MMIAVYTKTRLSAPKKDDGNSKSKETKIIWTPLVTTLAVLLVLSFRSIPENLSLRSMAEILVEVGRLVKSASQAKSIPPVVSQPFDDLWEEPKSSKELFGGNTKIIWAYWDKGLEGMPALCQHAVKSWKIRNQNWNVVILDDSNYQQYVSVSDLPTTFFSLKVQHKSDLLRLAVLLRYGGVYMDASTLLYKSLNGIWDDVQEDKLMLTSLTQLSQSGLELFNNGLLMTKGTNNKVLRIWQERILKYTEAPSLSIEEMQSDPTFTRVTQYWLDPSLGLLADMVPYHSNLWMLDDLIWNNDESVADHVISLPKFRWGFWFLTLPHLIAETKKQRRSQQQQLQQRQDRFTSIATGDDYTIDPSRDPATIGRGKMALTSNTFSFFPLAFDEDSDLATRILHNTHALKFTSHDLGVVQMAFQKFGYENTIGYLYLAATNTTMFPLQEATLDGATKPRVLTDTTTQT